MENNNEKEYWGSKFYGSKVNTVLLLVLIILMMFALRVMYKDKIGYLPFFKPYAEKDSNYTKASFKNSTLVFLKGLVEKYPESYIRYCSYKGKDFFIFLNHKVPDVSSIYDIFGAKIEECSPFNTELEATSFCRTKSECRDIYYNYNTNNSISKKFIDVLNLK